MIPLAHFGSPASHGGFIMIGSADMDGGYKVGGVDETKLFVLPGNSRLAISPEQWGNDSVRKHGCK